MISKIKKIRYLVPFWRTLIFYFFRIFPITKNKIVFCNFNGKGFGDNPKFVALNLLKKQKKFDLVWLTTEQNFSTLPQSIRAVNINSIKAIFELATAKVWIDNNRKPYIVRKRRNQYYIQTWHGNNMLKKIELDSIMGLSEDYILNARNDSKMIDLCISNSVFFSNFLKKSFWYNGEILECGLPKSDRLLNYSVDEIDHIKTKLGIDLTEGVLLYAPTFRNSKDTSSYINDFSEIGNEFFKIFKKNFKILVRLHPAVNSVDFNVYGNIIETSNYPDIQDLIIISDALITDYSSLMFDFGMLEKPVFLYMNDIDNYQNERGLYFEIDQLPFKSSKNLSELIWSIKSFNLNIYKKMNTHFNNEVLGLKESGGASEKITEIITNQITN